jgi:hypothetical protein
VAGVLVKGVAVDGIRWLLRGEDEDGTRPGVGGFGKVCRTGQSIKLEPRKKVSRTVMLHVVR